MINELERLIAVCADWTARGAAMFDPCTHSRARRIRAVSPGLPMRNSGRVVIFLVYSKTDLPGFTRNFISAANRNGYDVVVVSNAPLNVDQRRRLLDDCSLLIERANVGRDFGAYKDSLATAFERFTHIDRLILANDSVFFLSDNLDRLFAELGGPEQLIGVSEVHEHHYHVASFLLSFGPNLLAHPAFLKFWRNYLPLGSRMWAIMQGEGALTSTLMQAGFRPKILFRGEDLLPKIEAAPPEMINEIIALFPQDMRADLMAAAANDRTFGGGTKVLARMAVGKILSRNQMHAGGFAFMRLLGMPFFKRDIVYRELYSIAEVRSILGGLDAPARDEILADLDRRPSSRELDALGRILFRHGYV